MRQIPLTLSNQRRQWAAWLYQRLTSSQRARLREELMRSGHFPIAVLFYHRVANCYPNPWTISRGDFLKHLDWLQDNFDIVSLAEAQNRIRSGCNSRPTVAITFDDGYAENCQFAIPELLKRKLPATYFVATHAVAQGIPFAHDTAQHQLLAPNSISEIQELHRLGIEIGAHTRTHCDLGQLKTESALINETLGSIQDLESWGVGPIRYFSFPYGMPANTSQAAVDLLCNAGIQGVCTAYGAWNWPASPGFHLRRIHGDPGIQTLKNWLTLDRRKFFDNHSLPFVEPVNRPKVLSHATSTVALV